MSSPDTTFSSTPLSRSGPRSRKGCWTCRTKKVKCDENRPTCRRCVRLRLHCDYAPRSRGVPKGSPTGTFVHSSLDFSCLDQAPDQVYQDQAYRNEPVSENEEEVCTMASPIDTPPVLGSCGLEVGNNELEAIRYFRESFAPLYIMKNPKYSAFTIMLRLAAHDSLVMHMVLAIGGCGIDCRQQWSRRRGRPSVQRTEDTTSVYRSLGMRHYSNALRELHTIVSDEVNAKTADLDSLISALLLMIMYEQLHGDVRCKGLASHLYGTSLMIKHHYNDVLREADSSHQPAPLMRTAESGNNRQLSQYCARLLIRIIGMDASAASFGLGGQITKTLCGSMPEDDDNSYFPTGPIKSLSRLDNYSKPLYRTIWGEHYPAREIVDDLENRQVFDLMGASAQLRHLISEIDTLLRVDVAAAAQAAESVEAAIHETGRRYVNLLDSASRLSIATDNSHSIITNMRWVIPIYYTEVLEFLRIARRIHPPVGLKLDHEKTIHNIMDLAIQAFQHEGDTAIVRIARPLFMVALETADKSHLAWILERFQGLAQFGEHFARASDFLERIVQMQPEAKAKIDLRTTFLNQATSVCLCLT